MPSYGEYEKAVLLAISEAESRGGTTTRAGQVEVFEAVTRAGLDDNEQWISDAVRSFEHKGWVRNVVRPLGQPARIILMMTGEGRNEAERLMETAESRALRLLAAIEARTRDMEQPVFVAELAPGLGFSEQEANTAWQYLADKNLIRTYNLPYTARPSAYGFDALEKAKQSPNQPAPGFGSLTYNTITIHHMERSSIQQAGSHSTQIQDYAQEDFDDLKRAIDLLEEHFDQLNLDAPSARRAQTQIATTKAQLADEPNHTIIREAGKTLRNVIEGVLDGLISTAAQPGVWQFVQDVLTRMFSG